MKFRSILTFLAAVSMMSSVACSKKQDGGNLMDDLNPAELTSNDLIQMDKDYEQETGMSAHIPVGDSGCYQISCPVFALVDKKTQTLSLFVNGQLVQEWKVSTGTPGHETPNFDRRPDGRIYDKYSSKKYPGGSYNGLGNMPYVVFISGGYGIHGTTQGNFGRLGSKASHGCIRLHPDNGFIFNRLVRQYGIANTWITVQ